MAFIETNKIPVIVKHMALAVFHKAQLGGTRNERILQALEIAKSKLAGYGHVVVTASEILLTATGTVLDRKHKAEEPVSGKVESFDAYYGQAIESPEALSYEPKNKKRGSRQRDPERKSRDKAEAKKPRKNKSNKIQRIKRRRRKKRK